MQEILTRQRIKQLYGHSYTASEIKRKYPYSNKKLAYNPITKKGVYATYNPLTAMQMKIINAPCYEWGASAKDGENVFIFKRDRKIKPIRF